MKKLLFFTTTAAFIIGCGSEPQGKLDQLKAKKDSLKAVYGDLAKEIAALDDAIKLLDTIKVNIPLVTTKQVQTKDFEHYFSVQGVVEMDKNAQVFPEAPGKVIAIKVKEGQQVSKGDLLIQLDADVQASGLKELETGFALAKEVFEKQERLWNQKIGSEMQYLEAKTNKESLEQKVKTLKKQIAMYQIRAPFSGTVDEIVPKVGEGVAPNFPVARIVNTNDAYIKSDISEDYLSKIKEGSLAKITIPSTQKTFLSKVSRVGNYINPGNRTFKIRIDLNETGNQLKPNLLADLRIRDYALDSSLVLPSSIIQQDRKQNDYIYILQREKGEVKAKKTIIKPGLSYNGETVVLDGLTGDEEFIDKGARSVRDGDIVEITTN